MNGMNRVRPRQAARTVLSGMIVLIFCYSMVFVELPYYVLQPGTAENIREMVKIGPDGGYLESGKILLTTVGVGRANMLKLMEAVVRSYEIRQITELRKGGETEAEFNKRQHQSMLTSQTMAIQAAYRKAGIPYGMNHAGVVQADEEEKRVTIEAGEIGGPSAGLVFALEIYGRLTPGDLTKGYIIAGTGAIDPEGRVGVIGGIRHKAAAADREGADLFFAPADGLPTEGEVSPVPGENAVEALEQARKTGSRMKVVPVAHLEDAIRYLESLPPKGQDSGPQ